MTNRGKAKQIGGFTSEDFAPDFGGDQNTEVLWWACWLPAGCRNTTLVIRFGCVFRASRWVKRREQLIISER